MIKINTSEVGDVLIHLEQVNEVFTPPLSTRVDLKSYAKKICDLGTRFEYYDKDRLVGLVAVYANDFASKVAFVTNVSVLPQHERRGIGSSLINYAIEHLKKQGFQAVQLEADGSNPLVLSFYRKRGFLLKESLANGRVLVFKPLAQNA